MRWVCWLLILAAPLAGTEVALGELEAVVATDAATPTRTLLFWLPAPGEDAATAATWWRDRGVTEHGVTVVVPRRRGHTWVDHRDRFAVIAALRHAREHTGTDPAATVLGGEGDSAAFALRLGTALQGRLCGAILLARGIEPGRLREAGEQPPRIALFGNANDPVVPIRLLRRGATRLRTLGYPVTLRTALEADRRHPLLADLLDGLIAEPTPP